ncbi:MAG: GntR family transcriptional regulator [Anaerolineaceae bacterium]|nr:GntR family transcriptional regulator [Anaerolineaceae bacterium]
MKFNPTLPIYLQIMDSIKKEIVTGVLVAGERIESVRNLAEKYSVNLNTMQRACAELEREQVIHTQRGIGSFVTENQETISALKSEMSQALVNDFVQGMQGIGYQQEEILKLIKKALEK